MAGRRAESAVRRNHRDVMPALCEEQESLIGCGGLAVSEGKVGTRAVLKYIAPSYFPR